MNRQLNIQKKLFCWIITLLLVGFTGVCVGQNEIEIAGFVVVNDPGDTFVNLRSEANSNSQVLQKLRNGTVGYCYENRNKWLMFEYMHGDSLISGFVHNSLAKPLSDFEELKGSGDANSMSFIGRDIKVSLWRKAFNKTKRLFIYDKNNMLKSIDGKKAWGTDGQLPRYQYEKIEIRYDSQIVTLPGEAVAGLFEPNLSQFTDVHYDRANDILYISALNSDGAGSYAMTIIIENKKYRECVVAIPF